MEYGIPYAGAPANHNWKSMEITISMGFWHFGDKNIKTKKTENHAIIRIKYIFMYSRNYGILYFIYKSRKSLYHSIYSNILINVIDLLVYLVVNSAIQLSME